MKRILLVEDEASHAELIRNALAADNRQFEVSTVPSLAAARQWLERANPDLALVDLRLPDGRGDTLVEWARGAYPVVLLTAYGSERTAVETIKAGALDYVVKSTETFADMPHLMERALREWESLRERKRAEERLEKVNRCLLELGPDFSGNVSRLLAFLGELLEPRMVIYSRIEGDTLLRVGKWRVPEDFPDRQPLQGSLCGEAAARLTTGIHFIADFLQSPHAAAHPVVQALKLQVYLGHVVKRGGNSIGCLCLFFDRPYQALDSDKELLGIVASALGVEETRHEAEQKLRESEQQHRTLFELLPGNVLLLDSRARILDANEAFCRRIGYSRAELLGQHISLISRDTPEQIEQNRQRLLAGETLDHEVVNARKDGSRRHYELRETVVTLPDGTQGILAASNDITDRKRVEMALEHLAIATASRSGEGFFELLVKNLAAALGVKFALAGEMTGPDHRRIRTLAAWSENRLIENFEYDLTDTPCPDVSQRELVCYSERAAEHFPRDRLLSGMQAQAYVSSPLFDSDQQPLGILVAVHDQPLERPTEAESILAVFAARASAELERKQAEEARTRLETQLRQAQKMEAVGTLAGGIAHDFNNILTGILGNTELIRYDLPTDHPAQEFLNELLRATHRAKDLVAQILTFSRQKEQKRVVVQLWPIVREALKLLRASLPSTIEIRSQSCTNCPAVLADPTQIHQVVMNLCTNAAHAMEEKGGRLDVALSVVNVDQEMAGADPQLHEGCYVRLSVCDTGHGMDTATLERIFDPFFTTKPPGQGTGLGLAVVHGIVRNHEGGITVYSQPGEGAAFHLYFPAVERESYDGQGDAPPVSSGAGERLLFVDDEDIVAKVAARVLERLGYKVTACTDPKEALALFQQQPGDFELVITDYTMPGLTGTALSAELLKVRPEVPIILITGFTSSLDDKKVREMGIRKLLIKPFSAAALAESVKTALDRSLPA